MKEKKPSPEAVVTARIFVFGSNLAGRHGKGAALHARQHFGAVYGQGVGLQGRSYAIPTKDEQLRTLSLAAIGEHVEQFKAFAAGHPDMTFEVTPIGCGLAGYTPERIAPMFRDAPDNCVLPAPFLACLGISTGALEPGGLRDTLAAIDAAATARKLDRSNL
jgi:hypothetical protein